MRRETIKSIRQNKEKAERIKEENGVAERSLQKKKAQREISITIKRFCLLNTDSLHCIMTRYGLIYKTVIPETRHLPIEQFKLRDSHNAGKDWKLWLEEIEREFRYFRINTPTDKKDALIIFGGREIAYL